MTKKYDSTVARIAGNILSGITPNLETGAHQQAVVMWAVAMARAIVAETLRTEQPPVEEAR